MSICDCDDLAEAKDHGMIQPIPITSYVCSPASKLPLPAIAFFILSDTKPTYSPAACSSLLKKFPEVIGNQLFPFVPSQPTNTFLLSSLVKYNTFTMPFFEMLFRYADISSVFIPLFSSISIVRDASVLLQVAN